MRIWLWSLAAILSFAASAGGDWETDNAVREVLQPAFRQQIKMPPGDRLLVNVTDEKVLRVWVFTDRAPAMLDDLIEAGYVLEADRHALLLRWATAVNQHVVQAASQIVRQEGLDPHFNPHTDLTTRVIAHSETPPLDDFDWVDPNPFSAEFLGSRLTRLTAGPHRKYERIPPPADYRAPGVEVSVRIKPDKRVWQVGETIHGTLEIRNIGARRVSITRWGLDNVTVATTEGVEIERSWSKAFTLIIPNFSWTYKFLEPGETYSGRWRMATAQNRFQYWYNLPVGEYSLGFDELLEHTNIYPHVVPATVTVRDPAPVNE